MSKKVLSFGILGAANIAPMALISPAKLLPDICKVVGVAARDPKKAKDYATKYGIPKVFESYDDLIKSDDIDVVYIPLPNALHAEWTIKAIKAGKHVLCEKPFTSNAKEAEIVKAVHDESKVTVVDAFHYRYHPIAKRLKEVIDKDIGKLKHISVEMSFPAYMTYFLFGEDDIRYNFNMSGG
jgi:predicted dehydrogenase